MIVNFRETTVFRGFVLNALAVSLIAVAAVEISAFIKDFGWSQNGLYGVLITIVLSFITAMVIYFFMYGIFNFGGCMLGPPDPVPLFLEPNEEKSWEN